MRGNVPGLTLAAALLAAALSPGRPAAAQAVEGRVSIYNLASQFQAPVAPPPDSLERDIETESSLADSLHLRAWLDVREIGSGGMSFHLDARSDLDLLRTRDAFNTTCDQGDDTRCEERVQRHTVLGDLDRVAGVWDAYLNLGDDEPGSFNFSLGRKTVYEAGAVTVDGVVVSREMEQGRYGVFGGLAPNPETGIPDPQYQAAGAYYSRSGTRSIVRVAAAAQLFDLQPDHAYLYTQDFLQLAPGLTLSGIAQLDVVPFIADRLVLADLTWRPKPAYRLRLSLHRFRSVAFEARPLFREQLRPSFPGRVDPGLEIPDSVPFTEATTYHRVRVIGQLVAFRDITTFASIGARQRTVDNQVAPEFSVGATAFHPLRYPVQGRFRYRFRGGFGSEDHRVGLHLWRKPNIRSPLTFGGSTDLVLSKHRLVDGRTNPDMARNSSLFVLGGFVRYDVARFALFGSYEAALPSVESEAEPNPSLEHLLILGATMRFGQSSRRLF